MTLQNEAVQVLSKLLQFNTVNPPGNERLGQEWLRDYLTSAGFECELRALDSERPNLVARLRGESPGPTLGYLSHMDTVLVDPTEWSVDPWSGVVKDDCVWGRGAVDMKNYTAAQAVAGASLARSGWRPKKGELKIICVADEEVGGEFGARWLVNEHAELAHCDMLINEWAWTVPLGGTRVHPVAVAEKGAFRFSVKMRGTAGHASMPIPENNPLVQLAPIIEHLGKTRMRDAITELARTVIAAFGGDAENPRASIDELQRTDPRIARLLEPMLGLTFAPTRVFASDKINVLPGRAEVQVDCRFPPELNYDQVEGVIRAVIGEVNPTADFELEAIQRSPGSISPSTGVLMDAINEWVAEADPGAKTAVSALVASSDSTAFRRAFPDSTVYGFWPARKMNMFEVFPLVHAKDERIHVEDLGFGTQFFAELPLKILG